MACRAVWAGPGASGERFCQHVGLGTIAAYGWGMTYRIETSQDEGAEVLVFQGVLDRAALEAIETGCALARRRGARAVVLSLGTGSTVDGECIAGLRAIEGLAVRAASPFLAHWLRQSGIC